MIVIKVELWPGGNPSRKEDLGTAHIANEADVQSISTYSVRLLKGERYSRHPGDVWKTGKVEGFPRTSTAVGPWELLYLALESALGNRVDRARRLCEQGRRKTSRPSVAYAIGVSSDLETFGMTHGPVNTVAELLDLWPGEYEDAQSYILEIDSSSGEEKILYAWDGEAWQKVSDKR